MEVPENLDSSFAAFAVQASQNAVVYADHQTIVQTTMERTGPSGDPALAPGAGQAAE